MTRNIRKIVSIICAVALLLSLCAVSFIGSSSAFHLDAVEKDDSYIAPNGTTVLDLTFEGTNNGGAAMSTTHTGGTYIENGALYTGNGATAAGTVWIGKDGTVNNGTGKIDITGKTNCTTANTLSANLFELKPDTTYKITYKYAFRNDSQESRRLEFMCAIDPYLSSGHGRADSLNTAVSFWTQNVPAAVTETSIPGDKGYGEWKEDSIVFTTKSTLTNKYLGVRTPYSTVGGMYVKFDYIKVETFDMVVDNTQVYDWTTDGATPAYWNPNNNNFLSDSDKTDDDITKGSFVDADGLHFSFAHTSSPDYNKGWIKKGIVQKNNGSSSLTFESGKNYIITMKYKPELIAAGQSAYLGIGYGQQGNTIGTIAYGQHTETTNEWQYVTAVVAGSDVAGEILHVTGGSQGGRCSFLIESVTVRAVSSAIIVYETAVGDLDKEYDVVAVGYAPSALPVVTNLPEGKGFAGWTCDGVMIDSSWVAPAGVTKITAKFSNTISKVVFDNQGEQTEASLAVGLELPAPTRPNAYLFFDGWYTETTFENKVTTVPDYDVTLYAKYNGTFLNFNNISHVAGETSGTPVLAPDPDDATNTVVKFTASANSRPNFMIPAYDIIGSRPFELKTNTSYTVSYRVRLVEEGAATASITLYQGDLSKYDANTTTRTAISGTDAAAVSSEWTTVTCTFTTGDTFYLERVKWSYQNHLFFTIYNGKSAIEIYLDDFAIAESLTEAPEGTVGVHFQTNAGDMPSMFGYPGETIPALGTPSLAGHEFVGWYADKQLTIPFNTQFFGDKDITAYAKWKTIPFIVDFENYNDGGGQKAARAKFVKDSNGNNYLDWWVNHATTNTSDTGSAYRVFLNKNDVHQTATIGTSYTFTFKYKLLEGNVTIKAVTHGKLNGWSNYVQDDEGLLINKVTNDWVTATHTFTIDNIEGTGKYLSFGIAGHGHILVDDIEIVAAGARANLYGSVVMMFNPNGGDPVDAISGDPGEAMPKLPTATKKGYAFNGWFTDAELTTPFTAKVWGTEDVSLYASWLLGKFNESYEDFPKSALATGISGGYSLYNDATAGFDKANVQNGKTSVFRKGDSTGAKAFTLCRESTISLTEGKQYTLTFYVKPTNVTDAAGTISLIGMKNNTGIAAPASTNVITTVGDLKAGQWQKVSYTFTADSKYVGISSTAGNDMYLDNFTVTLKNYTGTTTGDSSVNPIIITMLIVLAAGALVVTGKKVFEK